MTPLISNTRPGSRWRQVIGFPFSPATRKLSGFNGFLLRRWAVRKGLPSLAERSKKVGLGVPSAPPPFNNDASLSALNEYDKQVSKTEPGPSDEVQ